jgi:hypothetical protein
MGNWVIDEGRITGIHADLTAEKVPNFCGNGEGR